MKLSVICSVFPLVLASLTPAPIHPRSSFVSHLNSAPGLSDLAKKAGLKYFGTAVDNVVLDNDGYTSIAFKRSEFNQVTASNGQKWVHTEPQRDFFNYTLGDQIVDASKEADQIRRCHTFLWHNQLPTWLTTEYYWDDCYAWDVVNEAFNDDGTLRKTIWLDAIGPEYIEHAFRLARQYASPGTKLYYNDYGIERVNNKSLAIARMIREYQGVGVPIDGVGLQAHFTVGRAPLYTDIRASQQLFSSLGLETALTELDVRMTLPDNANKTAAQATIYADSVRACADEESCVGVTVWDFWDTVSWVPETFIGEGNACLWNQNLQRKPAYYAVADVLRKAGEKRG